jgi:tRNA dimethylallyltransferase
LTAPAPPETAAPNDQPIFLAGPTAAGKSETALVLAERINGEIVSVDSMQVYRGLDIGTAKPTAAERLRVRHHLIDVVELDQTFDAARFVQLAGSAVMAILERGHRPLFCGGTGLYFKAYLDGLSQSPPADPRLRAQLEVLSLSELVAELDRADPVLAQSIDRQNRRRLVRALEVIRLTGQPFSSQRSWAREAPSGAGPGNRLAGGRLFCLRRAPEALRARIDRRVERMFARGLVDETRSLLATGLERNRTAMQAIGYRQVVEYLRGVRALPETIALVQRRTRQFAKRQMTWFRHQLPVEWINVSESDPPETIAGNILRLIR